MQIDLEKTDIRLESSAHMSFAAALLRIGINLAKLAL